MWNKQETSTGIWYNTPTTLGNISETTFCCIQKGLKHLGEILPSESDKCTTKRINCETHSHPIWFWFFLRIKWNTKYSVFHMRGTNHINITNERTHSYKTDKLQPFEKNVNYVLSKRQDTSRCYWTSTCNWWLPTIEAWKLRYCYQRTWTNILSLQHISPLL